MSPEFPLSYIPCRRYTDLPLPEYRHVPGYSPHPVRDALGHSYRRGEASAAACLLSAGAWRGCTDYLYGVDLFNFGFYWEAHEAWEPVWHRSGHESAAGIFAKALVQGAAVMLLQRTGRPGGIERLLARARRNFERCAELTDTKDSAAFGFCPQRWMEQMGRFVLSCDHRDFPVIELAL